MATSGKDDCCDQEEDRENQKKRLNAQKRAAARKLVLAARTRDDRHPWILLEPDGGDAGFGSTLANIACDFDFVTPAICSPSQGGLFQIFRDVRRHEDREA
jgi:hypothetical protein